MVYVTQRRKTVAHYVCEYAERASYLVDAEIRFKAYCARLYFAKRPWLLEKASKVLYSAGMMFALATAAQLVQTAV